MSTFEAKKEKRLKCYQTRTYTHTFFFLSFYAFSTRIAMITASHKSIVFNTYTEQQYQRHYVIRRLIRWWQTKTKKKMHAHSIYLTNNLATYMNISFVLLLLFLECLFFFCKNSSFSFLFSRYLFPFTLFVDGNAFYWFVCLFSSQFHSTVGSRLNRFKSNYFLI